MKGRQYTLHEITSKTPLVEKHHLGDFNNICPHCKARYFLSEATQNEKKYTLCCSKGSYSIPNYSKPPTPLLKALFDLITTPIKTSNDPPIDKKGRKEKKRNDKKSKKKPIKNLKNDWMSSIISLQRTLKTHKKIKSLI